MHPWSRIQIRYLHTLSLAAAAFLVALTPVATPARAQTTQTAAGLSGATVPTPQNTAPRQQPKVRSSGAPLQPHPNYRNNYRNDSYGGRSPRCPPYSAYVYCN